MAYRVSNVNIIRRNLYTKKEENFNLTEKIVKSIRDYLENPTKKGLWILKINLRKKEGITNFIQEIILQKLEENQKKHFNQEDLLNASERFTFLFRLFSYLYFLEKDENYNYGESNWDEEDKLILSWINIPELKEKYKDAFDYFKENIFFEDFNSLVSNKKLMRIKDGFFTFEEDNFYETGNEMGMNKIFLASTDLESLEKLKNFYEKVGKIYSPEIVPIFSPEEEVFRPYFKLLEPVYKTFIDNFNIQRLFSKSIDEYNDENNFSHCISTIGLITEDYLTQIFETLFRDICPKGLTLGSLYDLIHKKINQKFGGDKIEKPKINLVSNLLNQLTLKKDLVSIDEILKLNKEILDYIKADDKFIYKTLESFSNKQENLSIFPPILNSNINELIKKMI